MFSETDTEEWPYATHCGTAFVVNSRGRRYGITCRHVLGDFGWRQLVITDKKFGGNIAGLKSVAYPSAPTGGAVHSDILDVAVLQLADDVGLEFFKDTVYILDRNSVAKNEVGHALAVNGNLNETTTIGEGSIDLSIRMRLRQVNRDSETQAVVAFGGIALLSGSRAYVVLDRQEISAADYPSVAST